MRCLRHVHSLIFQRNISFLSHKNSYSRFFTMKVENNPLLSKSVLLHQAPDFTQIKTEYFEPALLEGMKRHKDEIKAIVNSAEQPSFKNTIIALELAGSDLDRAHLIFDNLCLTDSNDELMALEEKLSAVFSSHNDDIYLNEELYNRVAAIYNNRESLDLTSEELRLVEVIHKKFVRAGARLSESQKQKLRALNEEHSTLTCQFRNNLMVGVTFETEDELEGLTEDEKKIAEEEAKNRKLDAKYFFELQNTTRQTQLISLKRRDTRERLWKASAFRNMEGKQSNLPLVSRLALIRADKAALLGFSSWSDYALDDEMAKNPKFAVDMLRSMLPALKKNVQKEAEIIEEHAKKSTANENVFGIDGTVRQWDWEFYGQQVYEKKYELDSEHIKKFMELEKVLVDGVFKTMNRLFGVSFIPNSSLPVYHPDVRAYEVIDDETQKSLAVFYTDYYARKGKRGGAWMSNFVTQSKLHNQRPVVVNVLNIPKPPMGSPTLLTFDEALTLFHELGHGLHGIFSDVSYPTLSGTNTSTDFVEFPSTVHEDWAQHPTVVEGYARHVESGESLDQASIDKIKAARSFNQGFDTLEYVAAALLDIEWHTIAAPNAPNATGEQRERYNFLAAFAEKEKQNLNSGDDHNTNKVATTCALESRTFANEAYGISEFEKRALEKYEINDLCTKWVSPRYKSQYFNHSMGGGYSSCYYAYLWSEVLAADSFAFFNEGVHGGPDNKKAGDSFRKEILEVGNSRDLMSSFVAFRGREPITDELLKRRGLALQANDPLCL